MLDSCWRCSLLAPTVRCAQVVSACWVETEATPRARLHVVEDPGGMVAVGLRGKLDGLETVRITDRVLAT
jgi:hypothetical protein